MGAPFSVRVRDCTETCQRVLRLLVEGHNRTVKAKKRIPLTVREDGEVSSLVAILHAISETGQQATLSYDAAERVKRVLLDSFGMRVHESKMDRGPTLDESLFTFLASLEAELRDPGYRRNKRKLGETETATAV